MRRDRTVESILKPHGLTLTQWRVLLAAGWMKARTMNEVADYLALDRTGLSRAVDRLVEHGLLVRTDVAHDRRLTEIAPTETGKALRKEVLSHMVELDQRLLAGLDSETKAAAEQACEHLLERLVGHRAGARRIIDLI
ncbi:MarR family transcriptional regulator [Phenylobacterium sp.]|uniref:MarR family winged helix-turn-helix transcriptional regulator n=1 Tax=Phenylobacterium sp. TaxID=1871053 RepID=UPI0028121ABC|nr:MarR family transcriptional regulator [Phenylobacterium sp.]